MEKDSISSFKYYVYILESLVNGDFYKGSTADYQKRLERHNRGESVYTRTKRPWKLVYLEEFSTKREALIREKRLKRCNKEYLRGLLEQSVNILNNKVDQVLHK